MDDHIVYVRTNEAGYITAVNSSAFITDLTDWQEIDRGYGDKYHHAQNHFFHMPIITESGVFRYKMADGTPVECTAEEIAEQEAALPVPYDEKADMTAALDLLGVVVDG